jgi:NAD(P)H-flavin reductase
MIINNSYSEDMYLFWGVRTRSDLFYIEKFNSISNLTTKFFLSREENSTPYCAGRVNIDAYNFPPETEFYLCGNAPMVKEQVALLKQR